MVIDHFSDFIKEGEHVALIGESGAGKSTLLNSIVGLAIPSSGTIKVGDLVVSPDNIKAIRAKVGWLPQEVQLPYDTVAEMLEAPYHFKANKGLTFVKQDYESAVQKLGLPASILNEPLHNISGGERQRMLITSALILGRKVLLMDEPTSALDSLNSQRLIEYLQQLHDTTILVVTHDMELARTMDRQIKLKRI